MIRRVPPPWVFGVAAMPYGSFNGVVAVALPYLLRARGLPVERIATIEAVVQAPAICYVLWAPLVDIKFRRRTWIVFLSVLSGAATALALSLTMVAHVLAATVFFVGASVCAQPISSALGALVAVVIPDTMRGRSAGWSQAGILSGGIVASGLTIWLADHGSIAVVVAVAALLIGAPAFIALAVDEPIGMRKDRRAHIARVWRELVASMQRRDVWLGMVFFLSPVGAGALMNLFSAVASDYHASSNSVIIVVAVGGLLTAAGALVGGIVLDHVDRWRPYAATGVLTAACLLVMLFAPLRPMTYVIGAAAYALVTGFAYAAFMALALELIGSRTLAGGTLFTVFTAAVNVPVFYMLHLDGFGHAHFGVRGMLATDASANAAFGLLLLATLALRRGGGRPTSGFKDSTAHPPMPTVTHTLPLQR